jgi:hypothetical protein
MRNNNISFEGNMTRRFYEKIVTTAIMSSFEKIINLVYQVFFVQGSSSSSPGFHIFLVLVTTPTFSIGCFHANLTL